VKRADFPEPFRKLVAELRRLPGVGPRSAERMALWLLEDAARPTSLGEALCHARDGIQRCRDCGFFSETELCGVCADQGREPKLNSRLSARGYREVILALSTDVEGEATANFLVEILSPRGVSVTRLAQGMPAGGGLENADELTLSRALHGRMRAGGR